MTNNKDQGTTVPNLGASLRVKELEAALIDARDKGLIYWEPNTPRGHETKALMLARIAAALGSRQMEESAMAEIGNTKEERLLT